MSYWTNKASLKIVEADKLPSYWAGPFETSKQAHDWAQVEFDRRMARRWQEYVRREAEQGRDVTQFG